MIGHGNFDDVPALFLPQDERSGSGRAHGVIEEANQRGPRIDDRHAEFAKPGDLAAVIQPDDEMGSAEMFVGDLANAVVRVVVEHGDNRLSSLHLQGPECLVREAVEMMQLNMRFVNRVKTMRFEIGQFDLPVVGRELPRER